MELDNRLGKFSIDSEVVKSAPEVVMKVMAEVIVLRCEHVFSTDTFEYEAWSPAFDPLPEGYKPVSYDLIYSEDTDTITWSRQED